MIIIFEGTDTTVSRPFSLKTLLTFSLSVLSAAFGMSRFFKVGLCRLVPYGKMNVGFLFLVISIATCMVGKGTVYILGQEALSAYCIVCFELNWFRLIYGPFQMFHVCHQNV